MISGDDCHYHINGVKFQIQWCWWQKEIVGGYGNGK
jgi:hypothetical protein